MRTRSFDSFPVPIIQSQGIIERSHREIRAGLAKLVEAFVRANPRKWPTYIRYVEAKMRHKTITGNITPYSAVHGFNGSSVLSTAIGAIQEIPPNLIHQDWIFGIVAECKGINARLAEHWTEQADARARKHAERKPEPTYNEGDLVLVHKPFYERGTGAILPQCDGPYVIARVPTAHTVVLQDPLSGELFQHGRRVAVSRLIRFRFPSDWVYADSSAAKPTPDLIKDLRPGEYIAVEPKTSQYHRVHIARVERVFPEDLVVEVVLMHVPKDSRFGPWQRRRWEVWTTDEGAVRKELVTVAELICKVRLVGDALDERSLEELATHGINTGTQPRRDHTLPPRSRQSS